MPEAPVADLQQSQIVSRSVYDTMNKNSLLGQGIEDKVIINNKIAVSKPGEFLFSRNPAERWIIRQLFKPGLNLVDKFRGSLSILRSNIRNNLGNIVLRYTEESDSGLMRSHAAFFGAPS